MKFQGFVATMIVVVSKIKRSTIFFKSIWYDFVVVFGQSSLLFISKFDKNQTEQITVSSKRPHHCTQTITKWFVHCAVFVELLKLEFYYHLSFKSRYIQSFHSERNCHLTFVRRCCLLIRLLHSDSKWYRFECF